MLSPKLSQITICLTALFGILVASPVQLNEWSWTDQSGFLHEYELLFAPQISWDNARNSLETGWHLATITSEEEQESLITGLSGFHGEFWLGGQQSDEGTTPENSWAWETGEEWDYTNWAPGEPNDAYGSASEQHVAVWSRWGTDWKWNDEGFLPNIGGFVAERSHSVPEPSAASLVLFNVLIIGAMIRLKKNKER